MLTLLRSLFNVINTPNGERQLVTGALRNPDLSFTIPTAGTTTYKIYSFNWFHLDAVTMMLKSKYSQELKNAECLAWCVYVHGRVHTSTSRSTTASLAL